MNPNAFRRVRTLGALGALALPAALISCTSETPDNSTNTGGTAATAGGGTTSAGAGAGGGGLAGSAGSGAAGSSTGGGGASAAGASGGGATAGGGATGGGGTTTGGSSGGDSGTAGADQTAGAAGDDDSEPDVSSDDDMQDDTNDPDGGGVVGDDDTVDEWWFSGPRQPPPLGDWPPPAIKLTEVSSATQPTAIAAPRGDNSRIYFAEKWGVIRLIKDGVLVDEPALDLRAAVLEGGPQGSSGPELQNQGKRGLVGLAIHPDFEENGRIFVLYTADQGIEGYGTNDHSNLYDDGDMTLAEYRRSADDPDKFDPEPVSVFLQFDKGNCDQCSQHNGGSLEIDVDGFLWASTGDPPPYDNPGSQDLNNLNGKLLRFDISEEEVKPAGNYPGADPFVASIGIRNAYKFSVDRYTGDIFVGDVGENTWEEVTVERYDDRNKNHGWPDKEGFQSFMSLSCDDPSCLDPVFDYGHGGPEGTPGADNCIIGGYVYRGEAIPALQGAYVYGDYGSGKMYGLQIVDGELKSGDQAHNFGTPTTFMACFGEDAAGELYVCDYNNGKILRIDAQ